MTLEISITCPNPNSWTNNGQWANYSPDQRGQIDDALRARGIMTTTGVDFDSNIAPNYFYGPGSPCYGGMSISQDQEAGYSQIPQSTIFPPNTPSSINPITALPLNSVSGYINNAFGKFDPKQIVDFADKYKWYLLAGLGALLVVGAFAGKKRVASSTTVRVFNKVARAQAGR